MCRPKGKGAELQQVVVPQSSCASWNILDIQQPLEQPPDAKFMGH